MQKRVIKNERGRSACNDFSCDYFRCIFAKEKEFYSANEAYVLTNEEDATKSFNSVNPTTKQHHIQCHNWDKRKTMWVYSRPQFWFKD